MVLAAPSHCEHQEDSLHRNFSPRPASPPRRPREQMTVRAVSPADRADPGLCQAFPEGWKCPRSQHPLGPLRSRRSLPVLILMRNYVSEVAMLYQTWPGFRDVRLKPGRRTAAGLSGDSPKRGLTRRMSPAAGGMIAKTFFLAKIIHRIGTRSLRGKKGLHENLAGYRIFFALRAARRTVLHNPQDLRFPSFSVTTKTRRFAGLVLMTDGNYQRETPGGWRACRARPAQRGAGPDFPVGG
jgi:hypothetical protein